MSGNNGFIDLRLDHASQAVGDDSVWPSFTDIMTVIVMIFMMALVVIMLRNSELDQALNSTLQAKEETFLENQGLAFEVNNLKSRIGELSSSLDITQVARDQLNQKLIAELEKVEVLAAEKDRLSLDLKTELQRAQTLAAEKVGLQGLITNIQAESTKLTSEKQQLIALKDQVSIDLETTGAENKTLAQQLDALIKQKQALEQEQLQSRNQIALLQEKETTLNRQMDALTNQFQALQIESEENISDLSTSNKTLSEKIDAVTTQLSQLNVVLEEEQNQNINLNALLLAEQERYEELAKNQTDVSQRILAADQQIVALNKQIKQKELENTELQEQATARGQQLSSLRDEYQSLDERYRDLIRPARSTAGKYVVDVRVTKTNGLLEYRIREPEAAVARSVSKSELDAVLSGLKQSRGSNLYTKVIIPESSSLTHDEAWRFTQEILNKYDYYYQSGNALPASQ